jgi:hypothetical protein
MPITDSKGERHPHKLFKSHARVREPWAAMLSLGLRPEALKSVVPPSLRSGRFKATDKLIASLRAGTFMRSERPST